MYKPFNKWLGKSWKSLLLEPSAERKESITPKPWRPGKRADTSEDHFLFMDIRRKFKSQTSDNMDRWKSRGGKSQRRQGSVERRHTAVARSTFCKSKVLKTFHGLGPLLDGSDVFQAVHTAVARSTCQSQNCNNSQFSGNFCNVETYNKSARYCGPKLHTQVKSATTWWSRTTPGRTDVWKQWTTNTNISTNATTTTTARTTTKLQLHL